MLTIKLKIKGHKTVEYYASALHNWSNWVILYTNDAQDTNQKRLYRYSGQKLYWPDFSINTPQANDATVQQVCIPLVLRYKRCEHNTNMLRFYHQGVQSSKSRPKWFDFGIWQTQTTCATVFLVWTFPKIQRLWAVSKFDNG